jgi:hypothetical protein
MHPTADTNGVINSKDAGRRVIGGVRCFLPRRIVRLEMMRSLLILAVLSVGIVTPVCLADHLPSELQATGRPEKRLAGIVLGRSRVADVIKMYGKPSEVMKQGKPVELNVVDTYDYYWVKSGVKLHLLVYGGSAIKGGEYIALVEVEGSQVRGVIGRTGSGLKIGDGLAEVRRVYGRRFKERKLPKLNVHDVMIQWRREEFSLIAEFDSRGRIKNLTLSAPE